MKNKNTKAKANENKNKKILLKNLFSIYMKSDPNDQLPPSHIHKAQVPPPFEWFQYPD